MGSVQTFWYQASLLIHLLAGISAQSSLEQIKNAVSQDITKIWSYKSLFPDMESLKLNDKSVKAGLHYDQLRSRIAIENMLKSAVNNKNVNVFVLGGSVTQGGDLGENNLQLTYHYALADWWNKTIGSITRSFMGRKVVAVGGVGTTYFGHCWQEYVNDNDIFDFATWEFAINDPDSVEYEAAVERFIRDILSLESRPGLLFVNFASKHKLNNIDDVKCRENDAKVIDFVAKKYSTSSIRWERAFCEYNTGQHSLDGLFNENHPSAIVHAQMAYILIHYFREVILKSIAEMSFNTASSSIPNLPGLLFLPPDEEHSLSRCYTAITPGDFNQPAHRLTELRILENSGFSLLPDMNWDDVPETRFDSTGGYVTQEAGKKLKLEFEVKSNASKSRIFVTIRTKYFGGKTKFTLDKGTSNEKSEYSDASEKNKKGCSTFMLGVLPQGKHTITIETIEAGCNLCAIIID